jgi:hypothetical protein
LLEKFLVNRGVVIRRGVVLFPYENQTPLPSICDANSDRDVIFLKEKRGWGSRR